MVKLFQKIILLLFAFAVLFAVIIQAEDQKCPRNQEWKTCGTDCPYTCGHQPPASCTYRCVVGCQCKDGYMLNSNNDCVASKYC